MPVNASRPEELPQVERVETQPDAVHRASDQAVQCEDQALVSLAALRAGDQAGREMAGEAV